MKTKQIMAEDFYNPDSYADFIPDEHYHHSDKGCQIEIGIDYGNRPGEKSLPRIVKRCLTHTVTCSKEGWEHGWYRGIKSPLDICECGKELEGKNRLCYDCKKIHAHESKVKELEKRRQMSECAKRWKNEKNAKIIN